MGRVYTEGDVVGGYRLVRRIGAGAMGCVFEAEHKTLSRRVAIKLISPDIALSPAAAERFRLEGRLASMIAHPRCVFVVEADEMDGQPFIVMELMTGTTLSSLVQTQGPFKPLDAIKKILDVIDGLREAHKVGIIHRDVKPSNCFVDEEGRVKIGDFGLAKSIIQDEEELTHRGAFVGTVVYASPEQIKRQPLDVQSDIYSVCATLYFLLTGRPPFSGGDPLAVATRIVTEDPPALREIRPEIPRALERIVRRGLEREKSKRWPDLDSLHAALSRFLPGQVSAAGLGQRFLAGLVDVFVLGLILLPLELFDWYAHRHSSPPSLWAHFGCVLIELVFWLAYFAVPESVWGCSLGKLLFRLRVRCAEGIESPGLRRAVLRTSVFFSLFNLNSLLYPVWVSLFQASATGSSAPLWQEIVEVIVTAGGRVALFGTMRARHGFWGLHEWASGTRVTQLPWQRCPIIRRRKLFEIATTAGGDTPRQVGRFQVAGAVFRAHNYQVLLADDPALNRRVWITMSRKLPSEVRRRSRDLSRISRLRWVCAGSDDGWHWDAWLAPAGCPITELAPNGRLSWHEAAPLVDQLTHELTVAIEEGSLPQQLSVDQIWVSDEGRVQLIHFPWRQTPVPDSRDDFANHPTAVSCEMRAVELLRQMAQCLLEGQVRSSGPARVLAPLPKRIAEALNRLFPGPRQWPGPKLLRDELRRLAVLPDEVTRRFRVIQILALAAPLFPISILLFTLNVYLNAIADTGRAVYYTYLAEQSRNFWTAEFAVQSIDPVFPGRLLALAQWQSDGVRLRELEALAEIAQLRKKRHLDAYPRPIRRIFERLELGIYRSIHDVPEMTPMAPIDEFRREPPNESFNDFRDVRLFSLLVLPLVWLASNWLFRGGWSFMVAGLDIVRSDGLPASRLLAVGRGLLFWTPPLIVWLTAHFLQTFYWRHWADPGFHEKYAWLLTVSHGCWWMGAALWLVWVALAVVHPQRGPHDRIIGTWLVPR